LKRLLSFAVIFALLFCPVKTNALSINARASVLIDGLSGKVIYSLNENEKLLRAQHMKRISQKICSPEFTVIYADILHNIEKIGDSCTNIAEAVLNDIHFKKHDNIAHSNTVHNNTIEA